MLLWFLFFVALAGLVASAVRLFDRRWSKAVHPLRGYPVVGRRNPREL